MCTDVDHAILVKHMKGLKNALGYFLISGRVRRCVFGLVRSSASRYLRTMDDGSATSRTWSIDRGAKEGSLGLVAPEDIGFVL